MTSRVLYFPLISVPENAWFTRVLLYWDGVGAIVPREFARQPRQLTPYMRELEESELVSFIDPAECAEEIFSAGTGLLEVLDRTGEVSRRGASLDSAVDVPLIHGQKMGEELARRFVDAGLARRGEGSWFQVEARTADEFMTLLARVLGERWEMDPITDRMEPLTSVGVSVAEPATRGFAESLAELRMPLLEAILPGPVEAIEPSKMKRFKKQHEKLLADFRVAVDAALVGAAKEDDPAARSLLLTRAKQELGAGVDDVSAAMHQSGWKSIGLGIMAVAVPVAVSAVTGDVITLAGALPGLAYSAHGVRLGRISHDRALGKPLAYAAIAQTRFG